MVRHGSTLLLSVPVELEQSIDRTGCVLDVTRAEATLSRHSCGGQVPNAIGKDWKQEQLCHRSVGKARISELATRQMLSRLLAPAIALNFFASKSRDAYALLLTCPTIS